MLQNEQEGEAGALDADVRGLHLDGEEVPQERMASVSVNPNYYERCLLQVPPPPAHTNQHTVKLMSFVY